MKFVGPTALARHLIGTGASDDDIMTAYRNAFGPGSERPLQFTRRDLKRLRKRLAEGEPTRTVTSRGGSGNTGDDPKVEPLGQIADPADYGADMPDAWGDDPVATKRATSPPVPVIGTPTAVGVYIFAGGFTLGVKQAGFDVRAQLEDGPYGVASTRRNHPGLAVHTDPRTWPLDDLHGVHFVYGNPPCAPFSSAAVSKKKSGQLADWWKRDPRASCITKMFNVLETCRPLVWAWESVQPAFRRGRELVDELTSVANGLGYAASYVMMNAAHLGVPQVRRRFFCVFHRVRVAWDLGYSRKEPAKTVRDAWQPLLQGKAVNTKERIQIVPTDEPALKLAGPGESIRRVWERVNPPETWQRGTRGQVIGRPGFIRSRLDLDKPSPVILGGCDKYHPTEHRFITLLEQQLLCGYPITYEFVAKSHAEKYRQTAQAVMPPVGAWLARCVYAGLKRGEPLAADTRMLVDLEHGTCEVIT